MVEWADTSDLGSDDKNHTGSMPVSGTIELYKRFIKNIKIKRCRMQEILRWDLNAAGSNPAY